MNEITTPLTKKITTLLSYKDILNLRDSLEIATQLYSLPTDTRIVFNYNITMFNIELDVYLKCKEDILKQYCKVDEHNKLVENKVTYLYSDKFSFTHKKKNKSLKKGDFIDDETLVSLNEAAMILPKEKKPLTYTLTTNSLINNNDSKKLDKDLEELNQKEVSIIIKQLPTVKYLSDGNEINESYFNERKKIKKTNGNNKFEFTEWGYQDYIDKFVLFVD